MHRTLGVGMQPPYHADPPYRTVSGLEAAQVSDLYPSSSVIRNHAANSINTHIRDGPVFRGVIDFIIISGKIDIRTFFQRSRILFRNVHRIINIHACNQFADRPEAMHHVNGGVNTSTFLMPVRLILPPVQLQVLEYGQFARRGELTTEALFFLDQAVLMLSDNVRHLGDCLGCAKKAQHRYYLDISIHPPGRVWLGQIEAVCTIWIRPVSY